MSTGEHEEDKDYDVRHYSGLTKEIWKGSLWHLPGRSKQVLPNLTLS